MTTAISHFVIDTGLFYQIMEPKSFEAKKDKGFLDLRNSHIKGQERLKNIVN